MDGGSREVIEVSTWVRSVVFTSFMGSYETGFLLIWGEYYLYHNKLITLTYGRINLGTLWVRRTIWDQL